VAATLNAEKLTTQKTYTGSLPVSLSGPIANPTTRQKSFLTLMNRKANRLGGRDPPVYCNLLSSCDRTSEQKSRCRVVGFAIWPDRLTGSSPLRNWRRRDAENQDWTAVSPQHLHLPCPYAVYLERRFCVGCLCSVGMESRLNFNKNNTF
jgi:hypothetical protein